MARHGKGVRIHLIAIIVSLAVTLSSACRPAPTPTPTPTPTPSPTSTPTATPTATATPIPTPTATPAPPSLTVELEPPQVSRGGTLLIRVHADRMVTLIGTLDDHPLNFVGDLRHFWALAGIAAWSEVGPHVLSLRATDLRGNVTQATATVEVTAVDFPMERIDLPPDRAALLDPGVVKAERERLASICQRFNPKRLWTGPFTRPIQGEVTSFFGSRRAYGDGPASSYHGGVDLRGPEGTPIAATSNGRVVLATDLTVRGKAVILDHGMGVYSAYFHLSEILVEEGERVAQGDIIAHVGQTGLAVGPHLHWELRVGNVQVDPLEWTEREIAP